jgi:hypothetical protein
MNEMRLAQTGESTFSLQPWPNSPAVLLGRISIESDMGTFEATIAAGQYAKSNRPTLFIQPDPDVPVHAFHQTFEPNDYETAGSLAELLEFMEKPIRDEDLSILGFIEHDQ